MPPRRSSGSNLHVSLPSSTAAAAAAGHLPLASANNTSLPSRPSYGAVAASSMARSTSEVVDGSSSSEAVSPAPQQQSTSNVTRPTTLRSVTMIANMSDGIASPNQQHTFNTPSSARSTGAGQPQRRSVTAGPGAFDDGSSAMVTPATAPPAGGWESPAQLSQPLWFDGEQSTTAPFSSPPTTWVKPAAVTRTASSGPGSVWSLPAKVVAMDLNDSASEAAEARSRAATAAARGLLAPEEVRVPDAELSPDVMLPSAVRPGETSPTNGTGVGTGSSSKLRGLKKPLRAATLDPKHLLSHGSSEVPPSPVSVAAQPQAPHPQRPVYYDGYNPAFRQQQQQQQQHNNTMTPEMYAVYQHAPMHMDVAAFESYRTTPDPYAPIPPTPQAQHSQPLLPSSGSSGPSSVEQSPQFAPVMYGQAAAYVPNGPAGPAQAQQQYAYGPMIMQSPHMGAAMPMGVPWYPPPSPLLAHMGQSEAGSDKKYNSGHQQQQHQHQGMIHQSPHMYGGPANRSGGPSPPGGVTFSPGHSHNSSYSSTYGPPQRHHGGHRRIPTGPGGMMMPTGPHPAYGSGASHIPYGQLPDGSYYQQLPMSRGGAGGSMHSRNSSHASATPQYYAPQTRQNNGGIHFNNGNGHAHAHAPGNAVRQNSTHSLAGSGTGSLTNRSPLLEEFRSRVHKGRRFELNDILGSVVEFSGDQHGSRFTQERLDVATPEERQAVFDEILPSARTLMEDVFGNYVIQKLFEHGTQEQRTRLLGEMKGHILSLSLGTYGCRVVQKAIDHVEPEEQLALTQELRGHVLMCVKDQNANHVIQKIIERVRPSTSIDFIPAAFRNQVPALASHCYSCRVLQRILEHCEESQARPLLDELHRHTATLVQDQFGNYVTQFVLQKGQPRDRQAVIECARGKVLMLSKHKFASNVVEEIFRVASPEDRYALIEEILASRPAQPVTSELLPQQGPQGPGSDAIALMMRDQYANYVVQRSLVVAEGEQRTRLIAAIRPHLANMRTRYSKHLLAIEKLIGAAEGTAATTATATASNDEGTQVKSSASSRIPTLTV